MQLFLLIPAFLLLYFVAKAYSATNAAFFCLAMVKPNCSLQTLVFLGLHFWLNKWFLGLF